MLWFPSQHWKITVFYLNHRSLLKFGSLREERMGQSTWKRQKVDQEQTWLDTGGRSPWHIRLASSAREALCQPQLQLEVTIGAEGPQGQHCSVLWPLLNPWLAKEAQYFLSTHIPFVENTPLPHPNPEPTEVLYATTPTGYLTQNHFRGHS